MILYGKHILVRHSIAAFQRRAEADMRFTKLFVPQTPQSSFYRRAETEIQLAIPPTKASAEWGLV